MREDKDMLGFLNMSTAAVALPVGGGVIAGIIAVVLIIIVLASGYVKAPPDKAFIISGLGKKAKVSPPKAASCSPIFRYPSDTDT